VADREDAAAKPNGFDAASAEEANDQPEETKTAGPAGRKDPGVPLARESEQQHIGSYQSSRGATTTSGGPSTQQDQGEKSRRSVRKGTRSGSDVSPNELDQPGVFGDQGYGLDTDEPSGSR
jgi:hypothetical protein